MVGEMSPISEVLHCVNNGIDFVLQGGAGSGKTESLKLVLSHITEKFPGRSAVCITHTNLASEEIAKRVGGQHKISTIHSFLSGLIKNYTLDIQSVIFEIFRMRMVQEFFIPVGDAEHKRYKKAYEKFADSLFSIKGEKILKCPGKRVFDKDPVSYIEELDAQINDFNFFILGRIKAVPHYEIFYNESPFNRFDELSFGHDGLITISCLLLKKPKLLRILFDKYDYIFIDEYQDTNPGVIEAFVNAVKNRPDKTLGLFGDSMQGIYEDGIGDVEKYIVRKDLRKINKPDNYRCSAQVVEFINKLRIDDLTQEVALKVIDGVEELPSERQGTVKLYYAICNDKPGPFSDAAIKAEYFEKVNRLIEVASQAENQKTLILTNKAISRKAGFGILFDVFNERFSISINDRVEEYLAALQYSDVYLLISLFESKRYDELLRCVKKAGYSINNLAKKQDLSARMQSLCAGEWSAEESVMFAIDSNLIKESESRRRILERKEKFLEEVSNDGEYQQFKGLYVSGIKSYTKVLECMEGIDEYEYEQLLKKVKVEIFYHDLIESGMSMHEVNNYMRYLDEATPFITMHKTKGSGIMDTLVVMEDYFWKSSYNFDGFFSKEKFYSFDVDVKKILYVACSRTIRNLVCVRMLSQEERDNINEFFDDVTEVVL
ncbi:UvrD-helicase domain-containing protein [Pseudomonas fluorescens]|uniref:ATP-dependent helicase n=1 Tax=Pseudomonas fluorescens TaxID=294 RepID=A0A944DNE8_PSEFL|nr:UvrD-helicase domain-containing protein [Pseudomonas fluorescens]MBT2295279.1 ATP-dependent helicase [Pseudomonas fluorescens]MBT2309041.1 ATP-dependent helicase [Pseudomonas fluorescens]MBT2312206.1 ATP-dependent helicase [Pseudomonas fluorescens]MBT2318227.1 ATP-dependent helicase [Pseudomonas fluorescens]MBT2331253.1 ATP-dependent helicase [Pseudomonas fluorescens]